MLVGLQWTVEHSGDFGLFFLGHILLFANETHEVFQWP